MSKIGAFLIHPRDRVDMENYRRIAKLMPTRFLRFYSKHMKPGVVSEIEYNGVKIYLVGVFNFPRDLTRRSVLEGASFAVNELGAKVIGLGALTAPVTVGGKYLVNKLPSDIVITTGNSLTAAMTAEGVVKTASVKGWNLRDTEIAIVGATGSVGVGVSHLLVENLESPNLLLISRTERKLINLSKDLIFKNQQAKIYIADDIRAIKNSGIVVMLTSGPDVILSKNILKKDVVVYDITQPSNISPAILKERTDLLVIDGALVTTPGLDWGFDLRLPSETSFACLAETIFLTENGDIFKNEDFTGSVKTETARRMAGKAREHGFEHARLTSFRRLILKEEMRGGIYLVPEKKLSKSTITML